MSATGLLFVVGGGTVFAGILAAVALDRRRRRASIAAALGHDLSRAVEQHIRWTGVSRAEAERLDREFRRWFVVAAAAPEMIGMGSKAVDEYWHTLLDVDDGALYGAFSQAVAGRWIQHVEGVGSAELDARAWVAYEAFWGEPPPADLFPEPSQELKRRCRARRSDSGSSGGGGCGGGGASCGDGGGGGCGSG